MNDKRARSEQSAESDSLVVLPVVSHKKRGPSKMSFKNFMLYVTEKAMTRVQDFFRTEHRSIDENGILIDEW